MYEECDALQSPPRAQNQAADCDQQKIRNKKITVTYCNLVACTQVATPVNVKPPLDLLAQATFGECDRTIKAVKLTVCEGECVLWWKTGKLVTTGSVDCAHARLVLTRLNLTLQRLLHEDVFIDVKDLKVSNRQGTCQLPYEIDKNLLLENNKTAYQHSKFPGVFIGVNGPKLSLFNTGKVVITGAKDVEDMVRLAKYAYKRSHNCRRIAALEIGAKDRVQKTAGRAVSATAAFLLNASHHS